MEWLVGAVLGFFAALFITLFWIYWEGREKEQIETYTSRVRVPSTWRVDDNDYRQLGVADFQLGLGPCGLEVTRLHGSWSYPNRETYSVEQHCSDGSSKLFHYRREDITGRIEESFAKRVYRAKKS